VFLAVNAPQHFPLLASPFTIIHLAIINLAIINLAIINLAIINLAIINPSYLIVIYSSTET
jgi:hypothetical protein